MCCLRYHCCRRGENDSSDSDVELQKSLCSYVESHPDESAGAAEGMDAPAVKENKSTLLFGGGVSADIEQTMKNIQS